MHKPAAEDLLNLEKEERRCLTREDLLYMIEEDTMSALLIAVCDLLHSEQKLDQRRYLSANDPWLLDSLSE